MDVSAVTVTEALHFCLEALVQPAAREVLAARWLLDPLYGFDPYEYEGYEGETWFDLSRTLDIVRDCWEGQYVEFTLRLRTGESARQVAAEALGFINGELGADLDSEMLGFGIPIEPWGLELEDPDGLPTDTDVLEALGWFGLTFADGEQQGDMDAAYRLARRLSASLGAHGHPFYRQTLCATVDWLFGISGNSLLDYSHLYIEENLGYEGREWTPENVRFLQAVQQEADDIYHEARRGLTALLQDEALRRLFIFNIERAKNDGTVTRFYWSRRLADARTVEAAVPVELLSAECDSAQGKCQRRHLRISGGPGAGGRGAGGQGRIFHRIAAARRAVCRAERELFYDFGT